MPEENEMPEAAPAEIGAEVAPAEVAVQSANDLLREAAGLLRNEQAEIEKQAEEARLAEKYAEARELERKAARFIDRIRHANAALG